MTFLPKILSEGNLLSGNYPQGSQTLYGIETFLIEKLTEKFLGVLCSQSYDMRFNLKVPEPSLTLNGWITSTKEAIKQDVNFSKTRTTTSCMFAPSKGHSGGELIASEMMGHAAIPFRWKEYRYLSCRTALYPTSRTHRWLSGYKRRVTVVYLCLSSSSDSHSHCLTAV